MNNSDETQKKSPENDAVLQAIAELSRTISEIAKKVDNLEKFVTVQFDAVQEGIAYNSAKFDRLEAKFYEARSDISNMRADVKELTQAVRKKELV
jgi:uncharacterized protein YoxC